MARRPGPQRVFVTQRQGRPGRAGRRRAGVRHGLADRDARRRPHARGRRGREHLARARHLRRRPRLAERPPRCRGHAEPRLRDLASRADARSGRRSFNASGRCSCLRTGGFAPKENRPPRRQSRCLRLKRSPIRDPPPSQSPSRRPRSRRLGLLISPRSRIALRMRGSIRKTDRSSRPKRPRLPPNRSPGGRPRRRRGCARRP